MFYYFFLKAILNALFISLIGCVVLSLEIFRLCHMRSLYFCGHIGDQHSSA